MNEIAEQQLDIEAVEGAMLQLEQVECPVKHYFSPGLYTREIFMPAGSLILGHEHLTEHPNFVLSGRALVRMDDEIQEIVAPCIFVSKPGVRKMLYIIEDMVWATAHPHESQDLDVLEKDIITKSDTWKAHQLEEFAKHLEQYEIPEEYE